MGRHEKLHLGDLNGDGRVDLISFNRNSWAQVHLLVYNSTGNGLSLADRHYGTIPGFWQTRREDRLHVLDFTGDGKSDIALFNGLDWGPTYLGILRSNTSATSGFAVVGSWQDDWINGWNLGPTDQFKAGNFRGNGGWDDLFVFNETWFGLLRGNHTHFRLETIYRKWIFNHRYHSSGWW